MKPHKCPICEGRGKVPFGFYNDQPGQFQFTTLVVPETCRTCEGSGVLWEMDPISVVSPIYQGPITTGTVTYNDGSDIQISITDGN